MGTIELLGDRRNSGFCVMCGTDLVLPWNDYQSCVDCTKFIIRSQKVAENKKVKTASMKKNIVHRERIARQWKPIGGIPTE